MSQQHLHQHEWDDNSEDEDEDSDDDMNDHAGRDGGGRGEFEEREEVGQYGRKTGDHHSGFGGWEAGMLRLIDRDTLERVFLEGQ